MLHFFIFKSRLERATLTFKRMIFSFYIDGVLAIPHKLAMYMYFVLYEILYFTILLTVNVPLRLFLFVYKIRKIASKEEKIVSNAYVLFDILLLLFDMS